MIQHVIRNNESLEDVAAEYGVSWTSIADATFGGHTVAIIYNWLQANGGVPGGPYAGHASGTHWMFASGMVVNVPYNGASVSPVRGTPDEKPGGGTVAVGDPDPVFDRAAVGGGESGWTTWLLLGVAIYFLFGKKTKGKGRKRSTKKRKTTRRRKRR